MDAQTKRIPQEITAALMCQMETEARAAGDDGRCKGFLVALADDLSGAQVEETCRALAMVKGVLSVEPIPSEAEEDFFTAERVRLMLWQKVLAAFWPHGPGKSGF